MLLILKKIVLTGGGTAGHVMPHLAILPELEKIFDEIHYIGNKQGIEKDIIEKYKNIKYHEIPTVKLQRSFTFKNLLIPIKLLNGIRKSKKILRQIKPNVMFSKGGYVAVPPAFAAARLKIPIISHESDSTMGLANKLIYKVSKSMCFSFSECATLYHKKGVHSGSPIRPSIFAGNKNNVITKHNLYTHRPTILVMGGSLGAVYINKVITNSIDKLLEKYNVLHIVGKGNLQPHKSKKGYIQLEYVSNIEDYLACADLIISRAGSNSIFEFLALQKPMILIPLPKTSSRGDQIINANLFKKAGYADVILQENLTPKTLENKINKVLQSKAKYVTTMQKAAQKDAVNIIVNQIINAIE